MSEANCDFNPRSHERSDRGRYLFNHTGGISIHAPTRGATEKKGEINHGIIYFNPRSHERSDRIQFPITKKFQEISIHAPTRGATVRRVDDFFVRNVISIHAPTRGATWCSRRSLPSHRFQSTLPREERQIADSNSIKAEKFQSTLPREERQQYCTKNLFIFIQYRQ